MQSRTKSPEIDDRAAEWAARVDAGELRPEEEAQLAAWLDADVRHLGAFAKARAIVLHSERARALGPNFDPDSFVPARGGDHQTPSAPVSRRRALWVGGVAASAAAVVLSGGAAWLAVAGRSYSTRIGETRVVPLEDGSIVTLNTNSEVAIHFTDDARMVRLLRGEALFDVAKNRKRPFIVNADGTSVRAVGTSFTVELLPEQPVQVLVREGIVEVKRPDQPAAPPVRLPANTRAVTPKDAPIVAQRVASAEVVRALSWRVGRLAFEGETLAQAAAIFARYSETRIVIDDPAIANKTITGLYVSNDPVGFSNAVALSLDLHTELAGDAVHIRP
ncbi:MAG: FecR domain-containing protein [Rhizomicrobium sp.]